MMSLVIRTSPHVAAPSRRSRASLAGVNRCVLLLLFVVIATVRPAVAGEQQAVSKADWKIEIIPAVIVSPKDLATDDENRPAAQASIAPTPPADAAPTPPDSGESTPEPNPGNTEIPLGNLSAASYLDVYRSIPFIRAEYDANPSYRHDATMEILFGQLRPTVVHKYSGAPHAGGDHTQLRPWYVRPYWYRRNGRRMNYNFYYPYPTVYRRY